MFSLTWGTAGTGNVTGVVCGDGTVLPADVVIVGVGVIPNTELAADAGLWAFCVLTVFDSVERMFHGTLFMMILIT